MAYIQKRGDYTYRIAVSNGYDRNGKKVLIRKTITVDASLTLKQLEKELDRQALFFEEEVKRGTYIDSTITFEQFTQRWLIEYAEKNLERKTVSSYKGELETKILPAIGHVKVSQLQPLHLIKFYDNLTEDGVRLDGKSGGYSTRTIKYQHQIISSILQTAIQWQVLQTNICKNVKPPKGIPSKNRQNYFDDKQAIAFLDYIENAPLKYRTLVSITMFGGLRLEEVLSLTWNDVDFTNGTLDINKALSYVDGEQFLKGTKNDGSTRKITLPKSIITMLKEYKLRSKSEKLFSMHYNTPVHWLQKTISRYNKCHEEQLPLISFHGVRHTNATLLISQGLDIRTVSGRLGHRDTSTTLNIYSHYIKSRDKAASDALDELLNKKG